MNRPQPNEYPAWALTYIEKVNSDIIELLERQADEFPDFLSTLTAKADYAYASGKWTLKEMTGHIIDTERILVYRLTCFARLEQTALPGFEEDDYVVNAHFSDRELGSFAEEFRLLRKANLYLFKSLNDHDLKRSGTASERQISVRALLYVIAGHLMHHTQIINERYL